LVEFSEAWKTSFGDWSKERSFCTKWTYYMILLSGMLLSRGCPREDLVCVAYAEKLCHVSPSGPT
jgi:hypothetical protein